MNGDRYFLRVIFECEFAAQCIYAGGIIFVPLSRIRIDQRVAAPNSQSRQSSAPLSAQLSDELEECRENQQLLHMKIY